MPLIWNRPMPKRSPLQSKSLDPSADPPPPWAKRGGLGLTLDEGVSWMIAEEAGLDGRALALAGKAPQPARTF